MPKYIEECDDYWIVKDDNENENALVLRSRWSSRYLAVAAKYNVKIIRLNEHAGWLDSDLSFIIEIPDLFGVDVLSDKVTDVSAIFQLKRLKTLSLFCKAKTSGDFKELKCLRRVGLEWRKVFNSVCDHSTLQRINIVGYPEKDFSRFAYNVTLNQLRIESNELKYLSGIERFPHIRQLHLYRCRKLQSLDEITSASSIQELSISHCSGIQDWSPISGLSELKVLEIKDCQEINSVVSFSKCRKLQRLQIAGNTTILNGDLRSLTALPNLRTVLLAPRKHYSHSAKELEV